MAGNSPSGHHVEAVDPDVDLRVAEHRREWARHGRVLAVVSLGGVLGSAARWGVEESWPTAPGGVPWSTLAVNATGCLLIGVLMVFVVEAGTAHPLARPFLGVGVVGGYTTFSTYAVQTDLLLRGGHPGRAAGYLAGTALLALLAVAVGLFGARGALRARRAWSRRRRG